MVRLLVVLSLLYISCTSVLSQGNPKFRFDLPPECEKECSPEECPKLGKCEAGIVLDRCGCCEVCAKREFELCDHPEIETDPGVYYGKCGDNLECRVRTDMEDDEEPEAICYCTIDGALCGSDNVTYENLCQLMAAGVKAKTRVTIQRKGPCPAAPVIVSPPEHVKDKAGENVALVCEATGFPIPTIEWTWTRVDGKTEFLPSDDLRMSVNMRGGPEKWQVTGWLQIMEVQKEHEGDYTCIAQNDLGEVNTSARVKVINPKGGDKEKEKKKKRRRNKKNKNKNKNKNRKYQLEFSPSEKA